MGLYRLPRFAWIVLLGLAANVRAAGPATAPAARRSPSDERLTFLTLQLSNDEESIKAINTAMKAAGYKALVASDKVESSQKGNELMDRKGGGPVPWDQFYGKTAMGFNYHASSEVHIDKGRGAVVVDAQSNGSRLTRVDRPAQFDYLYKANNEQAAKAKDEIARMDKKLDTLLARRRQLEADQVALWVTMSLETVATREIGFQPLYRFKLQGGPASPTTQPANDGQLQIVRSLILYLRTADRAAAHAVEALPEDREQATAAMRKSIDSAYVQLQESMLTATATAELTPAAARVLKDDLVICKSMQTHSQNVAEANRLALEGDASGDEPRKQTFRGQLQQSLIGFAEATADLDDAIARLAAQWNVRGEPGVPSPDQLPAIVERPARATAAVPPGAGQGGAGGKPAPVTTPDAIKPPSALVQIKSVAQLIKTVPDELWPKSADGWNDANIDAVNAALKEKVNGNLVTLTLVLQKVVTSDPALTNRPHMMAVQGKEETVGKLKVWQWHYIDIDKRDLLSKYHPGDKVTLQGKVSARVERASPHPLALKIEDAEIVQ